MTETTGLGPALRAFLASDVATLRSILAADPDVVNQRLGDDTLLELKTQPHCAEVSDEVVDVLIEHGAALDRALNLAACWNLTPLVRRLIAAGADPSARADANITPLESAAMHGSTQAADVLVACGLHRPSLWLAAASGQLEMVRQWVDPGGTLLRPAGPYRPNFADVGRTAAEPANSDDDIVAEAFVFAAANARTAVVNYLLNAGVPIDARPYLNTTGLHLAIQFRKPDMVRQLLDRGASASVVDGVHQSDAHGWAAACDKGHPDSSRIRRMLEARQ